MDPKNLPNLDPKLREVYERVMKTPIASPNPLQNPQAQPPPPPASPSLGGPASPTPQPPVSPTVNNEPSPVPSVKPPAAQLSPTPQNTFHSTQVFNPDAPSGTASPLTNAAASKSKGKISPVVLVLAGVVFFTVYALLWTKVFNLSLPF